MGKKEVLLPNTLEIVGRKLIELRKQKGYKSHETFALDHELPRVQYWRLEKGKVNFTFKTLMRVLAIHEVPVDEFFASLKTLDQIDESATNKESQQSAASNNGY